MKLIKAVCCTWFESSAGNLTGKKERRRVKVLVRDQFMFGNCLQFTRVFLWNSTEPEICYQVCQTLKISCRGMGRWLESRYANQPLSFHQSTWMFPAVSACSVSNPPSTPLSLRQYNDFYGHVVFWNGEMIQFIKCQRGA